MLTVPKLDPKTGRWIAHGILRNKRIELTINNLKLSMIKRINTQMALASLGKYIMQWTRLEKRSVI